MNTSQNPLPKPTVSRKPKRNLAWIWLVPIVAALVGLSLIWSAYNKKGPTITISFATANGLEVGKTQVRFREVVIGMVTDIKLNDQRDNVLVVVELNKDAQGLAHDGSQFWVVKPRIGIGGVSGLGTLLSGAYIAVDSDNPIKDKANKKTFIGLEVPPPIFNDQPGTNFVLNTPDLGSLGSGSPIYFRRIQVGLITDYKLNESGDSVQLNAFVYAPYDKFVSTGARFWNESGIDISVGAQGVQVQTQSLVSILAGGLAFDNFINTKDVAKKNAEFKLYESRKAAQLDPHGMAIKLVMRFDHSTRGLSKGAPVDFEGIDVGSVDNIRLDFDPVKAVFFTMVDATIYPERLGDLYEMMLAEKRTAEDVVQTMSLLVNRGFRAQLKAANILTGQLYITLANFPKAPKASAKPTLPFMMPTLPADSLDKIQEQIASIITKLDHIPFQDIAKQLDNALKQLSIATANIDKNVTPQVTQSLKQVQKTLDNFDSLIAPDSQMTQNLNVLIEELTRSVQSIRAVTDSLQTQPDSILRGRNTKNYSRETLGAEPK